MIRMQIELKSIIKIYMQLIIYTKQLINLLFFIRNIYQIELVKVIKRQHQYEFELEFISGKGSSSYKWSPDDYSSSRHWTALNSSSKLSNNISKSSNATNFSSSSELNKFSSSYNWAPDDYSSSRNCSSSQNDLSRDTMDYRHYFEQELDDRSSRDTINYKEYFNEDYDDPALRDAIDRYIDEQMEMDDRSSCNTIDEKQYYEEKTDNRSSCDTMNYKEYFNEDYDDPALRDAIDRYIDEQMEMDDRSSCNTIDEKQYYEEKTDNRSSGDTMNYKDYFEEETYKSNCQIVNACISQARELGYTLNQIQGVISFLTNDLYILNQLIKDFQDIFPEKFSYNLFMYNNPKDTDYNFAGDDYFQYDDESDKYSQYLKYLNGEIDEINENNEEQ